MRRSVRMRASSAEMRAMFGRAEESTSRPGERRHSQTHTQNRYALYVSHVFRVGKVPNCPEGMTLRAQPARWFRSTSDRLGRICSKLDLFPTHTTQHILSVGRSSTGVGRQQL